MVMSASEKTKFINTFCEMLSEFIKTPEEIEKAKAEIELKNDTEMLTIKECSVIMRVSERTIRMLVKQNAIGSTRAGSGSCGKLLILPNPCQLRIEGRRQSGHTNKNMET